MQSVLVLWGYREAAFCISVRNHSDSIFLPQDNMKNLEENQYSSIHLTRIAKPPQHLLQAELDHTESMNRNNGSTLFIVASAKFFAAASHATSPTNVTIRKTGSVPGISLEPLEAMVERRTLHRTTRWRTTHILRTPCWAAVTLYNDSSLCQETDLLRQNRFTL